VKGLKKMPILDFFGLKKESNKISSTYEQAKPIWPLVLSRPAVHNRNSLQRLLIPAYFLFYCKQFSICVQLENT